MKKTFLFFVVVFAIISQIANCQTKLDSAEINSSVPELTKFHEVIFQIWHDAYPSKNVNALKGFVPQIKQSMEAVNHAKLPGILHDKQGDWNSQLKELNGSAEKYYSAAQGNDDQSLLNAAEDLHRNYEMMVRVIRPALKEIDSYHQTLYIIYHKLYPEKKYAEIAAMSDALISKADAIVTYPKDERLKRRLGNDVAEFDASAKALYDASVALKSALAGTDDGKKDQAVQVVHSAYQKLDSLF
jgi:hypothetical protein